MSHSPVAPSGAARRKQCPGSVKLEALYPEGESTPEQAEGDAAHWALAEMLRGTSLPEAGDKAPNGVFLTDEMLDAVDSSYDALFAFLKRYGCTPQQGVVESRVEIRRIHSESYGTPDFRLWVSPVHLVVADYKHGHRFVEVIENDQLTDYTAGLLPGGVDDRTIKVTFVVMQPRAFHRDGPFRTWSCQASDLRAQINISNMSAHEALGDNPRTRTGPECRDCRARVHCETFLTQVGTMLDETGRLRTVAMSAADIGLQLAYVERAQERLKAYGEGLREQAITLSRRGQNVHGWRMEQTTGREYWTVPVAQVADLGAALGMTLTKLSPITPNQARDAGVPPAVVAAMSARPSGGLALVRDDGLKARKVFG